MALTNGKLYVRVENIELGKNLMRFKVCEYKDINLPPLDHKTVVAPFAYTSNPFAEAYDFLVKTGYQGFSEDTVVVEETVPVVKPTKSKKKVTKE